MCFIDLPFHLGLLLDWVDCTWTKVNTQRTLSMQMAGGAWQARQVRRLCHLWPTCQVASADGHLAAAGLGGQLWVWKLAVIASADANTEEHLQLQAGSHRCSFRPGSTMDKACTCLSVGIQFRQ